MIITEDKPGWGEGELWWAIAVERSKEMTNMMMSGKTKGKVRKRFVQAEDRELSR